MPLIGRKPGERLPRVQKKLKQARAKKRAKKRANLLLFFFIAKHANL